MAIEASRFERAFRGTAPALKPGIRIGGEFLLQESGSAPFLQERQFKCQQLLEKQKERLATLPHDPIVIVLPDGSKVDGKANETTPLDVAMGISKGLAKASICAKVKFHVAVEGVNMADVEEVDEEKQDDNDDKDYILWDMNRPLPVSCDCQFLKFDDKEAKGVFWHSSAHLLGLAIEQCFGGQLTIGPALEKGFYYDFYCGDKLTISQDHYNQIQAMAKKFTSGEGAAFERLELSKDEALDLFADNPFKMALIANKVPDGGCTSAYKCGPFVDLCMGPHVPNLNLIKAFEVDKHSSAYWLGDKEGDALQRVYGVSFPDEKQMKEHRRLVEEARQRDHRNLGQQLDLFFFEPAFSPGSAFWLPIGAKLYNKLQDLMRKEYIFRGFQEVVTPNLFDCHTFKVSGHYQNYKDDMFMLQCEGREWGMKPMNCPGHCCIFRHLTPSYRQLPLRLADFGALHRNEASGALSGLTRVRRFQQDDAHIFCQLEKITTEIDHALDFVMFTYKLFGFKYELFLGTRPKKALGNADLWDKAEAQLKESLNASGLPWKLNKGDGAFYGPKIDIHLYDALGRRWQCGTIQLDFQLPLRFNLQYKTSEAEATELEQVAAPAGSQSTELRHVDGSLEQPLKPGNARPVMIHRAILGSIERFAGVLLEHTAGKLPFFVSPRQALVCPISEKNFEYAKFVKDILVSYGFDADVDLSNNTINKKIREAQLAQWNFILVVGAQEEEGQTVMARLREDPQNQKKMTLPELLEEFDKLRDAASRSPKGIPEFKKQSVAQ